MIIDVLKNAELYYGINEEIAYALDFLKKTRFNNVQPGRYNLEEPGMYYMVQQFESRPLETGLWEAHIKYIDIQYVFKGNEKMGYAHVASLKAADKYDEQKDIQFFEGNGSFVNVSAGMFVIFFPEDAHMPCLSVNYPQYVTKIVIKVPKG